MSPPRLEEYVETCFSLGRLNSLEHGSGMNFETSLSDHFSQRWAALNEVPAALAAAIGKARGSASRRTPGKRTCRPLLEHEHNGVDANDYSDPSEAASILTRTSLPR